MKLPVRIKRHFPFTWLGFLTGLSALALLSFSLMSGNALALIVSAAGLLLPPLFLLIAYLMKPRFSQDSVRWEKAPSLRVRRMTGILKGWESSYHFRWFFRRHLMLEGEILAGEQVLYRFRKQIGFVQGRFEEELMVPVAGLLRIRGYLSIRDVLGLVKVDLQEQHDWEFSVLPERLPMKLDLPELLSQSQQNQSRKRKEEQQKVFTREYVAGDLARDINWKAAARIGKLITRIPPESLGDSPLLQLYFRSPPDSQGLNSVFFLEHQKSVLLGFIHGVRRGSENRSFQIWLNRQEYLVDSDESLTLFEAALAECGFSASYRDYPLPPAGRQSCLFSSVLDKALKKELTGLDKEELQLFLCIPSSIEHPGAEYTLFQQWPDFLPSFQWLSKEHLSIPSYPRQLKGCYYYPLKGAW